MVMRKAQKKQTGHATRFAGRFVTGVAGLATLMLPADAPIRYPHRSPADAFAADWKRLGGDLRIVMDRTDARLKTGKKSSS